MKSGQKIRVTFNKDGKPVGDEGNELVQYLGTLVRMAEHVSIEYPDWRKVPPQNKEDMYTLVKAKFIIHPAETSGIKKWIMQNMGKKWRTWKGNLKARGFDKSLDIDQIVNEATKDNRVNPEQIKKLATSWFTPEHQNMCEVRKGSRSMMHEPHVTGTKSFARLAHEEALKNNGKYPTRGEIYIKSHTRKDGTIVDDKAAEVVASLQALPRDSTNGQESDYSNDDYSKVKGPEKRGYIRCVGRMPAVKESRFASSSNSSSTDSDDVQQLKTELAHQKNIVSVLVNLFQEHIPNANLSGVLSTLNVQIPDTSSSNPSDSPPLN
ncbi:uncharacterized protein [Rutidosis leptorrhynchoides]|uniref:uncharacterized protein n=1 Tax=Rutidosis leptorrhynchoides TaxID=125765 RepID=UPI003A9A45AA